ncbi:MAG: hypothetical protein IPM03_04480 [Sulfuritalea sp.]|nr:hypothetical protein [Sulfuritalea sp.]
MRHGRRRPGDRGARRVPPCGGLARGLGHPGDETRRDGIVVMVEADGVKTALSSWTPW